jgi:hypothetical protein
MLGTDAYCIPVHGLPGTVTVIVTSATVRVAIVRAVMITEARILTESK